MDSITQGLLGAVTAQLGFRQRIGRDATWVAAGAAVLPDLDIFIAPLMSLSGAELDGFESMRIHRGLSHSLLFAPVLSGLVTLLWWWVRRALRRRERPDVMHATTAKPPPSFALLYLCVLVAVLSAPLLDWCTSYGTCLLLPFTNRRYAIDAMPIIDLVYTPLLIVTLLACLVVRKITHSTARRATLIIGWTGFVLSVAYIAAGRILHDRAVDQTVRSVSPETVIRADAYPAIGSIFLWRVVVETTDGWHAARVHHFGSAPPQDRRTMFTPRQPPNRWIARARKLEQYKTYEWFADSRLRCEYERVNGVHVVRFHDMRYSAEPAGVDSLWPLVIEFDQSGQVCFVGRRMTRRLGGVGAHASRIWRDLWNP